jgi:hypothetical protein
MRVKMTSDEHYMGAGDDQHPFLFIARPFMGGSSVSHLEQMTRPNQLMEPFAAAVHDLSFTLAVLQDIGWSAKCGNGTKDADEECDDGAANSDVLANGCRTDCTAPKCGDGIVDKGEVCDDGARNDDVSRGERVVCRTSCRRSGCGDGIIDQGEDCDQGDRNSDRRADTCRTTCKTPRCGDGVVDTLEQCDDGRANSEVTPNACRPDCRAASCGDGIIDEGEQCDPGMRAADAAPCRSDCTRIPCEDVEASAAPACRMTMLVADAGAMADEQLGPELDASSYAGPAEHASGCSALGHASSGDRHGLGWLGVAFWVCSRRWAKAKVRGSGPQTLT